MKYKVGDKVRVKSDLVVGKSYGEHVFVYDMIKFSGKIVAIESVLKYGYHIKEGAYLWTDEMFESVEEMSEEEAIRIFGEFCDDTDCCNCPITEIEVGPSCIDNRIKYPEKVVEILKRWKSDHKKRKVTTEIVNVIKIIEETEDGKRCVYEEETDVPVGHYEVAMERILKKWYETHDGKFFAALERRCVARGVNYEYRRKN